MSRKKPAKQAQPPERESMLLIRAALVAAFALSAFLGWRSLQSGALPGCGPDSGCDRVLNSPWAKVFGVSVAVPALAVYGLLVGLTFAERIRWPVVAFLSVFALAGIAWFTALQFFVIHAFCPYCFAAHLAGASAAILLLRRVRIPFAKPALLALASVASVAVAQSFSPAPKPLQVPIARAATAPAPAPQIFSILGGQFQLDLSNVPVSGDPAGTNRVVKLFDYTCRHCRELHHLLAQYQRTNSLTVISLPMPLDPACNPIMRQVIPDHIDACEYARTGLAVFFANSEKFEQFSDWLLAPVRPYPLSETRAYAANLVGTNAFAAALRDPRVDQQLRNDIAIYIASSQRARNSRIPQLIFQNSASIGQIADLNQLREIFAANFSPAHAAPMH